MAAPRFKARNGNTTMWQPISWLPLQDGETKRASTYGCFGEEDRSLLASEAASHANSEK
jgi:hypothetical protein